MALPSQERTPTKREQRGDLEKDIKAFLKNGGTITQCEIGESFDESKMGFRLTADIKRNIAHKLKRARDAGAAKKNP
tara:strand:+ start:274 stop:504 length:231 start_codon:yes stop_codon:yes gene_type:complete